MSEREIRRLLDEVIKDIDAGRVDLRPRRRRLGRILGPPLVAATLGLAGGACDGRNVGATEDAAGDASAEVDASVEVDAGNIDPYGVVTWDAAVDGGNIDLYGVIVEDSGVEEDAIVDAAVDGDIPLPYAAPPIWDFRTFA